MHFNATRRYLLDCNQSIAVTKRTDYLGTYLIGPFYTSPYWRYFLAFGVIRAGVKRAGVERAKNIQFWLKSGVNFFLSVFQKFEVRIGSRGEKIKGGGWKQWIDDITYRLNSFAYVIWTIGLKNKKVMTNQIKQTNVVPFLTTLSYFICHTFPFF